MADMEHRSFPITKESGLTCGKYNTKRRRSGSNFRRIRQRQLDFQSIVAWKINIQSLPEDIVLRIVSKLSLKEAAQTSVLSSMWRQAWTYHPNLYFGIERVLGNNAKRRVMDSSLTNRMLATNKFIQRVDAILKNHWGTQVNKLAVKFGLSMEQANHIDRWVSFAITSKARIVTLNFSPNRSPYDSNNYDFPFQLFDGRNGSSLQALRLDSVSLNPPLDFCGFANLKALALDFVTVWQDLQHLLSKCCVLEWLSIRMCSRLSYLRVPEPLCRLQFLCVQDCAFRNIEFNAPNLTTFEYRGPPTLMNFKECWKLKTTTIRLNVKHTLKHVLTGIPSMLPHVENLCAELLIGTEMFGFTQSPHKFVRLRHLAMKLNFWGGTNSVFQLAYLFEAAPLLEDLHLQMLHLNSIDPIDLDDIMDVPHYHLKVVYMTGFCGNGGQVELAKYILNNALILEHLILKPSGKLNGSTSTMDELIARKEANKKLVPLDMDGVLTIL
ncbi:hypothetical protein ACP70R_020150 [Stipagrostis hirtigluma subsp. patula]